MPRSRVFEILGFERRRSLLDEAIGAAAGGRTAGAIGRSASLTVSASLGISPSVLAQARNSRELTALVRRTLRNFGRRGVQRIQREVERADTYETGLFLSSWKYELVERAGGFPSVAFKNDTPYGRWVHPKGRPTSDTVVKRVRVRVMPELRKELREDLASLRKRLGQRLKAEALGPLAARRRAR
ncbi:MAG TPA: hypothetical protein VD838_20190 [Anaeromyxobacteraceae bacterium]|nr:hypothetical protein [Anaeromyxobacteraceae bacterium]